MINILSRFFSGDATLKTVYLTFTPYLFAITQQSIRVSIQKSPNNHYCAKLYILYHVYLFERSVILNASPPEYCYRSKCGFNKYLRRIPSILFSGSMQYLKFWLCKGFSHPICKIHYVEGALYSNMEFYQIPTLL